MLPYFRELYGNPSSLHRLGRIARSAVELAREQVAALIDAAPGQIIFTSGGTEANALALSNAPSGRTWLSDIEHPAVVENAGQRSGAAKLPGHFPVLPSGVADVDALAAADLQAGDWVTLMLANNETGAIQAVGGLVERLKGRGVVVHSDAVQAAGKIPVSFSRLGVDLMTLSSHKLYGPKGCGALVCRSDLHLMSLQRGGGQERDLRAGTENVAAIVGFGKAAELARLELASRSADMLALRYRLEAGLQAIPGLVIFAHDAERLPNTVQFGIAGVHGEMLLMQLDKQGIAVSSGSACAAGSDDISPVLAAMGIDTALARSAIRVSLGENNDTTQIDRFITVLNQLLTPSLI